jgi:hypothetical protein
MDVPLWASLPVVLLILAGGHGRVAAAAQWLFRGTVALLILGSGLSIQGAARLSRVQALGRESLLRLAEGAPTINDYRALFGLYPDTQVVLQRYWILKDHRLSCFREPGTDSNSAAR